MGHQQEKDAALRELCTIPGVGKSISRDLWEIGIRSIVDLKGRNPDTLYRKLCRRRGAPIDRCVLYVFRCAVYFASKRKHEPRLLHWWNWKNP
jgi:pyruvate-formate lyase-activating enzyme